MKRSVRKLLLASRDDKIIQSALAGAHPRQIATSMGLTKSVVYGVLHRKMGGASPEGSGAMDVPNRGGFNDIMDDIVWPARPTAPPEGDGHDSDCAIHNAPAYEPGPCDCSFATAPDGKGDAG